MAESFVERRKRELGLSNGSTAAGKNNESPSSNLSFVERRKVELGLMDDPRPKSQQPNMAAKVETGRLPSMNVANSPLVQDAQAASKQIIYDEPAGPSRPGRDIPVIGPVLRGLDVVSENPVVEAGASVLRDFYTPGGGLRNVANATSAVGNLVSRVAPNLGRTFGGRVATEAIKEGVVGAPLGAGQALAQGQQLDEAGKQAVLGAGLGAVGGAAFPLAGKAIQGTKLGNAIDSFFNRSSQAAQTTPRPEVPQVDIPAPQRLRVESNPDVYINRAIEKARPVVTENITPPLENPNELAKWVRDRLGVSDLSLNEVRKMPYEDLRQLAEEMRRELSVRDEAYRVARTQGYDLPKLFDRQVPDVQQRVSRDASARVAGVYPETLPKVQTPALRPKVPEVPEAPTMQGNWFTNLFGNRGVGISAVSSSKRIGAQPLTTADQLVKSPIRNDAEGIKAGIAAQGRALYQNYVDQLNPLKRISNQAYDTAMDSVRANNIANTIVRDKFVTPEGQVVGEGLSNIFKKVARGQDKQFVDYLTLRHAKTRIERGERVYADNLGMTPDKVQQRLDMYDKRHPGFSAIAQEWDQFNDNLLQNYGVNEGLISEDLYRALRQKNPNYSPMRRQFSLSEKPGQRYRQLVSGGEFSGQKAPLKRVSPTGSVRDIVDPRRTTIETVGAWANAAMRNRVMQTMVDAIKREPEAFKGVAEIVQKPKNAADLRKVLLDSGEDEFVESLNNDFKNLFKPTRLDQENIVRAMVNGEPVYLQVHDPELVKTLVGLGPQASNILIDTFNILSNATKRGATGALAPVFAIKDVATGLFQSAIQAKNPFEQAGYTVYGILSGIGDRLRIPGLRNLAEEYRRAGGEYSAALKGDRKLRTRISDMTRDPLLSPKGIGKGIYNAIATPFRALEAVGDIAENAPRMAAYKRELNRLGGTRTPENVRQAMSQARESTVNYSRRGAFSRGIEAFIPYNNAAIQGTYRVMKSFKDHPVRTTAAVAGIAVLPKLYEYSQFADDPDYQKLPARERFRFLIVDKNEDGSFVKIPMEPAYNSFGEIAIEALRYLKDNDEQAFKDTADALANAWLPPLATGTLQGVTQGGGVDKSIAGAFNSTVLAPFAATMANQSFTGAPIESKAVQDRSTENRYDERTSSISKEISKYTGLSPMKTDYLIRAYGGDPARLLLPLTSDVGAGTARNTLLKNFIVDPEFTNTLTNDFYGGKEKLTQAYRDNQEVGAALPSWFDEKLYKEVTSQAKSSVSKKLSALSEQKKKINTDQRLTSEQKAKNLREIQSQMNDIYMDINAKLYKQGVPLK